MQALSGLGRQSCCGPDRHAVDVLVLLLLGVQIQMESCMLLERRTPPGQLSPISLLFAPFEVLATIIAADQGPIKESEHSRVTPLGCIPKLSSSFSHLSTKIGLSHRALLGLLRPNTATHCMALCGIHTAWHHTTIYLRTQT